MTLTPSQIEKMKPEDRELAELCEKAKPNGHKHSRQHELMSCQECVDMWAAMAELQRVALDETPRLLGEKVELEEQKARLERYAQHLGDCAYRQPYASDAPEPKCDCGLTDALAGLSPADRETPGKV